MYSRKYFNREHYCTPLKYLAAIRASFLSLKSFVLCCEKGAEGKIFWVLAVKIFGGLGLMGFRVDCVLEHVCLFHPLSQGMLKTGYNMPL